MKKYLLFLNFMFLSQMFSQAVTPIMEVSGSQGGIAIFGNELYVASSFDGEIYKIDWTDENATMETINVGNPWLQQGLCIYGDYLCIAWNNQNKIVRLNLSSENPVIEDLVPITTPNGIAIHDNDLYVSSGNSINKFDLSVLNPVAVEILNGLNVNGFTGGTIGLKVFDNYLYITENDGVYKVNLNSSPYIKELVTTITGTSLVKHENFLYIVEQSFPGKIHKVNLETQTSSILVELPSMEYPTLLDIAYVDNKLFVSCLEGLKVAKIDLSTLNVKDLTFSSALLYPNPCEDYLEISGYKGNYTIINSLGQELEKGDIDSKRIDVSQLSKGIYYIIYGDELKKIIKK
jgi:Secretion system C-terminal sorting domain